MEDPRAFESQESSEGQVDSAEVRALDTATLEPEAAVEQGLTFEQAEAIQTAFTEVVDSTAAGTEQLEGTETVSVSISEEAESSPQAGDEVSASPQAQPDESREAGQADIPAQEMHVELPEQRLEGSQSEGQDPLGDLQQGLPGTGGMGDIPGSEDPFGSGMSDPFGEGSGPGGFDWGSGGFGEDPLGGFGMPGIPNFSDPFGDMPGSGPGGIGGDTPGGPGAINFGRTPMGGGASQGGADLFWRWNALYDQEPRFQHAREMAEFDEASTNNLEYDPSWTPPPSGESRAVMDPWTGSTEEWGTATSADYDAQEEHMEDFVEAQRDYEDEKRKQEEARSTVSGGEASMPRPDEGGEDIGPVSPEDINIARVGGIIVGDPAYSQWGPTTSAVDFSKTPGGVTDPGHDDGGVEKGGGVRAGGELVTDPPETDGN